MTLDPLKSNCTHCGAAAGEPCVWAPVVQPVDPPPLYHAERIEAEEFAEAMLQGQADPKQWKAALDAAAEDLF